MKSTRWTFALAAGTVLVGTLLGGVAHLAMRGVQAQDGASPRTLSWVPRSAAVVGHVDWRSVAASPLAEDWSEKLRDQDGLSPADEIWEAAGIDLLRDVEGLTFSVSMQERAGEGRTEKERRAPEHWGVAVTGSFDAPALVERLSERQRVVELENHRGTALYRLRDPAGQAVAIAVADQSTLLFGRPDYLRSMIDAHESPGPSGAGLLNSWGGYESFREESFFVVGTPLWGVDSVAGATGALPPLRSFALTGRLASDVLVRARGRASDPEAARQLADVVRGFAALSRLGQGTNPQLQELADSLQIDLEEDEVQVSLAVPYETLRQWMAKPKNSAAESSEGIEARPTTEN